MVSSGNEAIDEIRGDIQALAERIAKLERLVNELSTDLTIVERIQDAERGVRSYKKGAK